jgi:ABC-type multidrug transport system fused ATPase/permease subunit
MVMMNMHVWCPPQLSVGEKQLLCIARAFLCKAQVVVFDEASSSVDANIGYLIHQSISKGPSDEDHHPTLLIIAHRLSSVDACDLIMVLDVGRVKECGSPGELLGRPDSVFARMMACNAL